MIAIFSTVSEFTHFLFKHIFCSNFAVGAEAMGFVLKGSKDQVSPVIFLHLGSTQITVFIAYRDVEPALVTETFLHCVLASTCLGINSLEDLISGLIRCAIFFFLKKGDLIRVECFVKELDFCFI